MTIKSNIPEILAKLERLKTLVGGNSGGVPPIPDFSDAIYSAMNAGMGKMKFRIFNKGLDAEGQTLGKYTGKKTRITKGKLSVKREDVFREKDRKKAKRNLNSLIKSDPDGKYSEYEKKRLAHGRQVLYKDLEFDGSLRASIEPVRMSNRSVVIAITNDETAKIAGYQEEQVGRIRGGGRANIFTFSQAEIEQVKAEGDEAIRQTIVKLYNGL